MNKSNLRGIKKKIFERINWYKFMENIYASKDDD